MQQNSYQNFSYLDESVIYSIVAQVLTYTNILMRFSPIQNTHPQFQCVQTSVITFGGKGN